MKVQVLHDAITFIILILSIKISDECAEQLQRCAIITEEYERLIQETKHSAFRNCFTKQICNYEFELFENCFERSIRAVRASFNQEILKSDNFIDSAHRYLSALEDCFDSTNQEEPVAQFPDFKPTLIDEDAIYARTVYSLEFVDHLWGLPQLIPTYPYLENSATLACLIREKAGRIFGSGINRFIDSADLKLNNASDSCLLEENEIQCYRRQLSNDRFYQQLLIFRDHVLRSCIRRELQFRNIENEVMKLELFDSKTLKRNELGFQATINIFRSVRLQTQCHSTDASRLRACLCSAREEFENRIQASILQCVRQSHVDHLRHERQQSQRQWHEQRSEYSNKLILNTGTIWNGQCLCACPHSKQMP